MAEGRNLAPRRINRRLVNISDNETVIGLRLSNNFAPRINNQAVPISLATVFMLTDLGWGDYITTSFNSSRS